MKLVRHYIASIDGVEIFGILGFIIFFLLFIALSIHTFRIKDSIINKWSNIPFDDSKGIISDNDHKDIS